MGMAETVSRFQPFDSVNRPTESHLSLPPHAIGTFPFDMKAHLAFHRGPAVSEDTPPVTEYDLAFSVLPIMGEGSQITSLYIVNPEGTSGALIAPRESETPTAEFGVIAGTNGIVRPKQMLDLMKDPTHAASLDIHRFSASFDSVKLGGPSLRYLSQFYGNTDEKHIDFKNSKLEYALNPGAQKHYQEVLPQIPGSPFPTREAAQTYFDNLEIEDALNRLAS